jgi:hypothetical protein
VFITRPSLPLFICVGVTCVQYLFETVLGLFTMFNPLSKSRKLWAVPELLGGCKYGEHDSGAPLAEHLYFYFVFFWSSGKQQTRAQTPSVNSAILLTAPAAKPLAARRPKVPPATSHTFALFFLLKTSTFSRRNRELGTISVYIGYRFRFITPPCTYMVCIFYAN